MRFELSLSPAKLYKDVYCVQMGGMRAVHLERHLGMLEFSPSFYDRVH